MSSLKGLFHCLFALTVNNCIAVQCLYAMIMQFSLTFKKEENTFSL